MGGLFNKGSGPTPPPASAPIQPDELATVTNKKKRKKPVGKKPFEIKLDTNGSNGKFNTSIPTQGKL